jgi:fumarate reductase subunit C
LAQGEAAFGAWLAGMKSPASIVAHVGLLVGFIYHTWSWFEIMPKTMPPVVIGGKRLPPAAIIGAGLVAAVIATIVVLAIAMMLAGRAMS